jgi:hypothetical protein
MSVKQGIVAALEMTRGKAFIGVVVGFSQKREIRIG